LARQRLPWVIVQQIINRDAVGANVAQACFHWAKKYELEIPPPPGVGMIKVGDANAEQSG
jgi:hypothetical protein